MKQRFKGTISWNKYGSEIITQPKNNNLDYMVYPAFMNINRLFVLSFKNGDFIGKSEENDGTTVYFNPETQQILKSVLNKILNFSLDSLNVTK